MVSLLLLASCAKPIPLPSGLQTVTGKVERTQLSLGRRGTHLLTANGRPLYYMESSTLNLFPLEGREITAQGTLQLNIDQTDLPVLEVTKILKGAEEPVRTWTSRSLGIALQVPRSWTATMQSQNAIFTASGSTAISLKVFLQPSKQLPFDFSSLAFSGSKMTLHPFVLATRKAVIVTGEVPGQWTAHIDAADAHHPQNVLTLSFSLDPTMESGAQITDFEKITHSLSFLSGMTASDAAVISGTGAAAAMTPCGGPAGVLCPAGFYCQITDVQSSIGHCRPL
jgi:hypothetical protein